MAEDVREVSKFSTHEGFPYYRKEDGIPVISFR